MMHGVASGMHGGVNSKWHSMLVRLQGNGTAVGSTKHGSIKICSSIGLPSCTSLENHCLQLYVLS